MKTRTNKNILFQLFGIVLLIVILYKVDWVCLKASLIKTQFKYLIVAIPLVVVTAWVKSWRWLYIVRKLGVYLPAWHAFIYYTVSFFWGTVTPGRVGEFAKIIYMKETGTATSKAVFSVVIDRCLDLLFLGIMAAVGIILILDVFSMSWLVLGALAIVLFAYVLFWHNGFALQHMKRLILLIIPNKFEDEVQGCMDAMQRDLSLFSFRSIGILVVLLILSWVCHAIPLFILGWGMGIHVPFSILIMSIFLSSAISMLPISVGGIGTRDGFLIFYLGRQGISMEDALLFSFMFIYIYIIAIIIGYLSYLWKPRLNFQKSAMGM